MSKMIATLSKMWLKVANLENILPQKNKTTFSKSLFKIG
jgi:hypothetical protein